MRILLMEYQPRLSNIISRGLTDFGFQVVQAHDGETGMKLADEGAYDVAVINAFLPKIDGLTVYKRLRQDHFRTPILILAEKQKTRPASPDGTLCRC